MSFLRQPGNRVLLSLLIAGVLACRAIAQTAVQTPVPTTPPAQATPQQTQQPVGPQIIGHIDASATAERIQVAGAVTFGGGSTLLGNGSTVTAGDKTLPIQLTRGGELDLCSTTSLHLSQQNSTTDPNSPLQLALDQGAIEAHYSLGKNSDVVLTPDLRILLSGPGKADVSIRVNAQGDTCVDNHGNDAPYLTVSEQIGSGVYRVQPNQRVMFEHGSVRNVVDKETQPCGCPVAPVVSVASTGTSGKQAAKPGETVAATKEPVGKQPVGGPSSTPADTAFPLAESEGLAAPPTTSAPPAVAPGVVQSQVTTTLAYTAPTRTVPTGTASGMATPESAATVATLPAPGFGPSVSNAVATAQTPAPKTKPHSGFFHKIGHFFARIFG